MTALIAIVQGNTGKLIMMHDQYPAYRMFIFVYIFLYIFIVKKIGRMSPYLTKPRNTCTFIHTTFRSQSLAVSDIAS
jgi:hypothetical protein